MKVILSGSVIFVFAFMGLIFQWPFNWSLPSWALLVAAIRSEELHDNPD